MIPSMPKVSAAIPCARSKRARSSRATGRSSTAASSAFCSRSTRWSASDAMLAGAKRARSSTLGTAVGEAAGKVAAGPGCGPAGGIARSGSGVEAPAGAAVEDSGGSAAVTSAALTSAALAWAALAWAALAWATSAWATSVWATSAGTLTAGSAGASTARAGGLFAWEPGSLDGTDGGARSRVPSGTSAAGPLGEPAARTTTARPGQAVRWRDRPRAIEPIAQHAPGEALGGRQQLEIDQTAAVRLAEVGFEQRPEVELVADFGISELDQPRGLVGGEAKPGRLLQAGDRDGLGGAARALRMTCQRLPSRSTRASSGRRSGKRKAIPPVASIRSPGPK